MFNIKPFDQLTTDELYKILSFRAEVFVVEQECPYNDLDFRDQSCTHISLVEDDVIVGYIRVVPRGISYEDSPSIGRVITHPSYRKKGIAHKLVTKGMEYIFQELGEETITISAQEYAIPVYKKCGFKVISDVYLEDGLPHVKMTASKKDFSN